MPQARGIPTIDQNKSSFTMPPNVSFAGPAGGSGRFVRLAPGGSNDLVLDPVARDVVSFIDFADQQVAHETD